MVPETGASTAECTSDPGLGSSLTYWRAIDTVYSLCAKIQFGRTAKIFKFPSEGLARLQFVFFFDKGLCVMSMSGCWVKIAFYFYILNLSIIIDVISITLSFFDYSSLIGSLLME